MTSVESSPFVEHPEDQSRVEDTPVKVRSAGFFSVGFYANWRRVRLREKQSWRKSYQL